MIKMPQKRRRHRHIIDIMEEKKKKTILAIWGVGVAMSILLLWVFLQYM